MGQLNTKISKAEIKSLDPSIRHGRLSNGLTYYIKDLKNGLEKIDMSFYVQAGNYHEEIGQLDFAHAVEHLAFKCAKHFPVSLGNPEFYSELGMTNYDVGGRTFSLHSEFYFNVPSNRMDALDTGLLWFHDILDLELTAEKINSERGPLRQEVVFRNGSRLHELFNTKLMESKLFPCQQDFFNFFEHNQQFFAESLRAFYKDWYLPDRMAVVIVGDIADMTEMENKVKKRFSNISNQHSSKWSDCRKDYLNYPDQFTLVERKAGENGIESGAVDFYFYMRDVNAVMYEKDWHGVQRDVIWGMLRELVNHRFKENGNTYNTSFSSNGDAPHQGLPAYRLRITERKENGKMAIKKTIGTLHQVKKYGFNREEWDRAKRDRLESIKKIDTTQSAYWKDQIQNHYVYGEVLPKNKEVRLYQWLSALSLQEFNALARQILLIAPNDIGIIAPTGKTYTESQVRGWIDQALLKEVTSYMAPEIPKQLMTVTELSNLKEVGYENIDSVAPIPKLENGHILRRIKPRNVIELVLKNGVKVVLDTTYRSNNNSVYLHGFSPKGASSFPKEDYFSAINAPAIIKNAGVGMLDKFQVNRFLAETSFWQGVHPYIENMETGIKGNASLKDFEKLLQLVYLYFVQPRADKTAFEDWKLGEEERYLNPTYSLIHEDFDVLINEFLGNRSKVPHGTKRFDGIPQTDMDRAYAIYQQLYGNAKDFTFLVSGNFSVDIVLPLLQKYLGNLHNLPSTLSNVLESRGKLELADLPRYKEFFTHEINAPYELKSTMFSMRFVAKVENPMDWKEHIKVEVLGTLLGSKIKDLRYIEGMALYSPIARSRFNRIYRHYDFTMLLECVPEELEAMRQLCKQMVLEIKMNSFSPERLDDVMRSLILPKFNSKLESTFVKLQKLYNHYVFNEPWIDPIEIENYAKSLTPEDIQATAQKYLNNDNMFEFVFRNRTTYP